MTKSVEFLGFRIPADVDILYRGHDVVPLEPRSVQVLRYLANNPDRVVTKQELLDHVWADVFTSDGVLKRAIFQCRKALEDPSDAPHFIQTHHGRGYRFVPSVVASDDETTVMPDTEQVARARPLPLESTRFIGRERCLEELGQQVGQTRLLTLTGPGGIGKTRLALRLAHLIRDSYDHGVAFVPLESIGDGALIPARVAEHFGIREAEDRSITDTLAEALKHSSALVVLDNCEHLIEGCASFVSRLLGGTSHLRVIATGRESLGITGECIWRVPEMTVPSPDFLDDPECVLSTDATRLFVDRVELILPGFKVTAENAPYIAAICRRLEGIPLALELAAALVASLSVEEIADRLADRFRVLTRGDRSAPARRQTMRAAIDWSYALLTPREQRLFRWLSVFRGFDLEAVEAVYRDEESSALDLLARLVDKSLVVAYHRDGRMRYRMLETLREYALEKLKFHGEMAEASAEHAQWVFGLTRHAEQASRGPREKFWLERLELEHDNARAALRWSHEVARDAVLSANLCDGLMRFWDMRGHWGEGRVRIEEVLSERARLPKPALARMLYSAGMLARHQSDTNRSEASLTESLRLFREMDDTASVARGLNALGNLFEARGAYERAIAAQEECLALFDRINDDRGRVMALSGLGMCALDAREYKQAEQRYSAALRIAKRIGDDASAGIALHNLGDIAFHLGDNERARELLAESCEVADVLGFKSLASHSFVMMGDIALAEGDGRQAKNCYHNCLKIVRELNNRGGLATVLDGFARVSVADGDFERALRLAGAAEALRDRLGVARNPAEQEAMDLALAKARSAAGEKSATQFLAEGARLRSDEALKLVPAEPRNDSVSDGDSRKRD